MVVVGGIRANQYADGHGGLGYYEALGKELTTSEDGSDRASGSLVGRLRYTDVNADAARTERVASFVRFFVVRARQTLAGVGPFVVETPPFRPFDKRWVSI